MRDHARPVATVLLIGYLSTELRRYIIPHNMRPTRVNIYIRIPRTHPRRIPLSGVLAFVVACTGSP